ncbi:protein of unknown function [Clostridium beijerinckii]|nr:protein of unknown function [Clostridium beijerinckii]
MKYSKQKEINIHTCILIHFFTQFSYVIITLTLFNWNNNFIKIENIMNLFFLSFNDYIIYCKRSL